jgi:hypothetical protein
MEDQAHGTDVFISFKSADAALAEELYHFLISKGLTVFLSSESLPQLGSSDYRKAIDKALDECKHMIVVGSKVEYLNSSWVEAEWGFYINEKRAGRKKGNILTVITSDMAIKDLPASLRYYQVIFFDKDNFDQVAAYVGKNCEDPVYKPKTKNLFKSKWIMPVLLVVVLSGVLWYYINEKNQPFDITVFAASDPQLRLNPDYPAFESGRLSLYAGNKADSRTILPGQPVTFQQIPSSFLHKKVAVSLDAPQWKLAVDSVVLDRSPVHLVLIPNGAMGTVFGNIKDGNGNGIAACSVAIDTDTTIQTNAAGYFKIDLPFQMQKRQYILSVTKDRYQPERVDYFPGSGNIDILLQKK